jgi:hypothetical protein
MFAINDKDGIGWTMYDVNYEDDLGEIGAVVVGRIGDKLSDQKYRILVVKPRNERNRSMYELALERFGRVCCAGGA